MKRRHPGALVTPAVGFLSLGLLAGCMTLRLITQRPARLAECPGILVPSEQIDGDFLSRMQIQITSEHVAVGYDLILQKKGDRLVLIGLTRFGAKAFSVVQVGRHLEVESTMGPATQVPPANILRDLHRARFLGAGPAPASGVVESQRDGESLRDTWSDGTLRRRELDSDEGDVVLEFVDARTVRIDNRRCDYRATLVDVDIGDGAPDPPSTR